MAEAHAAVAFSFSVTSEGVQFYVSYLSSLKLVAIVAYLIQVSLRSHHQQFFSIKLTWNSPFSTRVE